MLYHDVNMMIDGKAVGVKMKGGQEIRCKRAVVSGAGYLNTMKLLNDDTLKKHSIPRSLDSMGVEQSMGFVMCNIGIQARAEDIGVTNTNTWHVCI
jgi:hypothetical protein